MPKNVLLVGIEYTGEEISDTNIEALGLCRPKVCEKKAAYSLYEYDVVIINPASYSHFIFGKATEHSTSDKELWDLKRENNDYDLDSIYDLNDREEELKAAIAQGTRVIWLLNPDKKIHFFGQRSLYGYGYASPVISKLLTYCEIHQKKSKRLTFVGEDQIFKPYFDQLQIDSWRMCFSDFGDKAKSIAETPEGYSLGAEVKIENSVGWLLTAPTSQEAANLLVLCALGLDASDVQRPAYHGIFLSHTADDKPFVRELKKSLEEHGVENVWLDEAEIQIGDSLSEKIEEGLTKTKYIGIVLSPKSIESKWVKKELEVAMNREIETGEVVILPLLYQSCKLPAFLAGKLYADFTTADNYSESLKKLLRRLKMKDKKGE
jgi:hypothetical protein